MDLDPKSILSVLDHCAEGFTFPALDNGYWYLATARMSLFRSTENWALVIEVFGYSPRGGTPDISITTFSSKIHNREAQQKYKSREAYKNYLEYHPNDEMRFVFPTSGEWQDEDNEELVAPEAEEILLRQQPFPLPLIEEYEKHGITLENPPDVRVFELCRYLAEVAREQVLSTVDERRINVLPEMQQIMQLEDWRHPDVIARERPSHCETFQQLANVLATGRVDLYSPTQPPNTHWSNWPEGGTL